MSQEIRGRETICGPNNAAEPDAAYVWRGRRGRWPRVAADETGETPCRASPFA